MSEPDESCLVPVKTGAIILVQAATPGGGGLSLVVQGKSKGRESGETEEWVFAWPDPDFKKLQASITQIDIGFDEPPPGLGKRTEKFYPIYDWLAVGCVGQNHAWEGHVRFSKDGRTMESMLKDTGVLIGLPQFLQKAKLA